MEIILSFATEVANSSIDHELIKRIAEILTKLDITGNFHLTGDYARALRKYGRCDIIRALRKHEIGYHCNHHGANPFMPGYIEGKEWDEGIREWLLNELPGARIVESVIGKAPVYYTTEFAAAAQVVRGSFLGGMGISGYLPLSECDSGASWFCGSFVPGAERLMGVDAYLNDDYEKKNLERFNKLSHGIQGENLKVIRAVAHSYRFYTDYPNVKVSFPDQYQRDHNYEDTPSFPHFPEDVISKNLDKFTWLISQMKTAENAEFLSYTDFQKRFRQNTDVWLDKAQMSDAANFYSKDLNAYVTDTFALSPAEAFGLFVRALRLWQGNGVLPGTVCVRDILGPLHSSSAAMFKQNIPIPLLSGFFRNLDIKLDDNAVVPSDVVLEGMIISPGQFLQLMAKIYLLIAGNNTFPESFEVQGDNFPRISTVPFFQQKTLTHYDAQGNSLYPEGFTGADICKVCCLQSWTWKPAVRI